MKDIVKFGPEVSSSSARKPGWLRKSGPSERLNCRQKLLAINLDRECWATFPGSVAGLEKR